jgi:hypothetical protein
VRRHIVQRARFEAGVPLVQTTALSGVAGAGQVRRCHDSTKRGVRRMVLPAFEPETEHPRSHVRSVTLTGSSLRDLAAVRILTRPFRLQGHALNQTMHICVVSKSDVSIAATINLGAQPCLHVSPILLGSTQLPGTCGEMPLRGNKGSVVKQGCRKSEDQSHRFRYHMTRTLRDAFPLWLHRDAFQLDNMYAVGSGLESRRVCAGQLLPWRRNSEIATRFPAEY